MDAALAPLLLAAFLMLTSQRWVSTLLSRPSKFFLIVFKFQIMGGLPDTIDTYGIVSGLWTSVFALGAFVGKQVNALI